MSRPVVKLERMPGPRVTDMKSGLCFSMGRRPGRWRVMVPPDGRILSLFSRRTTGRAWRALLTR